MPHALPPDVAVSDNAAGWKNASRPVVVFLSIQARWPVP
jgi:hypothetical protein